MKRLTGRSWGVSMAYRLKKLAEYVRGWMNYFGIAEYYRPIPELDHWLRASSSDVLLETVAHMPDEGPQSAEARGAVEGRHFSGDESEEFLASVKDLRDAAWHDESVVERTGRDFHQGPVGEHALPGYGPVTSRNAPCGPA